MWPLVLPPGLARAGQLLERRLAPPFYRRTQIITLSESSKAHLLDRLRLPDRNVHVVPPGIDSRFRPGDDSSTDEPTGARRRSTHAVEGVRHADRRRSTRCGDRSRPVCVIVGEGYERDALERQIAALGAEEWCELVGRVDDDELVAPLPGGLGRRERLPQRGLGHDPHRGRRLRHARRSRRGFPGHRDAVRDGVSGVLVDSDDELVDALGAGS